jgi:hypothetical protein
MGFKKRMEAGRVTQVLECRTRGLEVQSSKREWRQMAAKVTLDQ